MRRSLRRALWSGSVRLAGAALALTAPAAPSFSQAVAYIPNSESDSVSIVEMDSLATLGSPDAGSTPWGVAVHPSGVAAYVTNIDSDDLAVLDPWTLTTVARIPVGDTPKGVAVAPAGDRIYVTNQEGDEVAVVDAATWGVVGRFGVGDSPRGIVLSPDGSIAYVANGEDDTVTATDLTTEAEIGNVFVGDLPKGIAIDPSGSTLYVTNFGDETLAVVGASDLRLLSTLPLPAVAAAVHPDGDRVYVTTADDRLVVLSTQTLAPIADVAVGVEPRGVALRPDGTEVLVANAGDGTVTVVETERHTVVATFPVGREPMAFGDFVAAQRGAELVLEVTGVCPGEVELDLSGAALRGRVTLVSATESGFDVVPAGPCAGTELGVVSPQLLARVDADGAGGITLVRNAPSTVCGRRLQALDETTCRTSVVVDLPGVAF